MKTLKVFAFLFTCFSFVGLYAQEFKLNLQGHVMKEVTMKNTKDRTSVMVQPGTDVVFTGLSCERCLKSNDRPYRFSLVDSLHNIEYELLRKSTNDIKFQCDNLQDLWDIRVITDVLGHISKHGYQKKLRQDMESDALIFLSKARENGEELDDSYLLDYLYRQGLKVFPKRFYDHRNLNLNILIHESVEPNAKMFPNGTLVLTTGMLSILHSEDELMALLSHEISHLVLDHSVVNVNKAILRKKRLDFWAGALTGLTAVAEGVVAAKTGYVPGLATIGVGVMSSALGSKVVDYLGMNYNHRQEFEADSMSVQVLEFLGYNPQAMSSLLNRIKYSLIESNDETYLEDCETHPALQERIDKLGEHQLKRDSKFEKVISNAVTNVAAIHYRDRRFKQALPFLDQNIANGIATSDDYVLRAHCLLHTKDTPKSNAEVLDLVEKAKSVGIATLYDLERTEIIAHLRLGHKDKAMLLLQEYIDYMKQQFDKWNSSYAAGEIKWAETTLHKLPHI